MAFFELIKAAIIGIVQGITEWLPISSTGHIILIDEFIKLNVSDAFKDMFFVVIQLGSILAVLFIYFQKLNPFDKDKNLTEKRKTVSLWFKVIVAIIPAGIIGVLFNDAIDSAFYNYKTVSITLILYGILFILLERRNRNLKPEINSLSNLNFKTALFIGAFQVLALIPGTSRSGSTILGAMILGTSRSVAAEFSFFLAIPIMFGASAVKLLHFGFSFSSLELSILLTGCIISFVVSIFAIKFLVGYIKKHDFTAFGVYRIILGIVVVLYFLLLSKPGLTY